MLRCREERTNFEYSLQQICPDCGKVTIHNFKFSSGIIYPKSACWGCMKALPSMLALINDPTTRFKYHVTGVAPKNSIDLSLMFGYRDKMFYEGW